MSVDARTAVLDRIRKASKTDASATRVEVQSEWAALPRAYEQTSRLNPEAKLDLLEDRLRDYGAEVTRVADLQVAPAIASVLAARGNRPTLLPQGFPAHWVPADSPLTIDTGFSSQHLGRFDGVVTGATLGIAETGTLILQNVAGQGRRAGTLVPDFHLCVVRAQDIVENVPEAFARLTSTSTLLTTFVSGPSATADIEMTRIKGVHGPRFLHVFIVSE